MLVDTVPSLFISMSSKACQLSEVHLYQKPLKLGVYEGIGSATTSEHGEIGGAGGKNPTKPTFGQEDFECRGWNKNAIVEFHVCQKCKYSLCRNACGGKKPVKYRVLACVWQN